MSRPFAPPVKIIEGIRCFYGGRFYVERNGGEYRHVWFSCEGREWFEGGAPEWPNIV